MGPWGIGSGRRVFSRWDGHARGVGGVVSRAGAPPRKKNTLEEHLTGMADTARAIHGCPAKPVPRQSLGTQVVAKLLRQFGLDSLSSVRGGLPLLASNQQKSKRASKEAQGGPEFNVPKLQWLVPVRQTIKPTQFGPQTSCRLPSVAT